MEKESIIKVDHLSKQYMLTKLNAPKSDTLYGSIANQLRNLKNFSTKKEKEAFWALTDVSFDIKRGDRVGIIGRNGAGKSTLLKVLSRITPPTSGRVEISGRVASLLEVGTGFHGDLSGRENIYLNGSILGMSKQEITAKFDEIVSFAEIEKFLDTPVKRYSSGMYVRLAFAVAAHLEPDILIVDEVLAVGDAEFQKKCLGKMKHVSAGGRTILFVSHNMAAIQSLCDTGIYLENGKVVASGNLNSVMNRYLKSSAEIQKIDLSHRKDRSGNGAIQFESVELRDEQNNPIQALQCGKPGKIWLQFNRKNNAVINNLHIAFAINDESGIRITQFNNEITNQVFSNVDSNQIEITIPQIPFRQGSYSFVLYSTVNNEIADWVQDAGSFEVEAGDFYNTGKLPPDGQGNFFISHSFKIS